MAGRSGNSDIKATSHSWSWSLGWAWQKLVGNKITKNKSKTSWAEQRHTRDFLYSSSMTLESWFWGILNFNGFGPTLEVIFDWRSSIIEGCLALEVVFDWRLLSYESPLSLEVFSIGGCLPLEVVFCWRSSSIKVLTIGNDPMSCYWDISIKKSLER